MVHSCGDATTAMFVVFAALGIVFYIVSICHSQQMDGWMDGKRSYHKGSRRWQINPPEPGPPDQIRPGLLCHTTNGPHQSQLVAVLRTAPQKGLGTR